MATKKPLTQQQLNDKFNALPPKKKMVAIAKDVLAQLALFKYRPTDVYLHIRKEGKYIDPLEVAKDSKEAQLLALENDVVCDCCARGAIVMSRCRLGNTVTTKELSLGHTIHDVPSGVLEVSERLYENWAIGSYVSEEHYNAVHREVTRLGCMSREQRLKDIMQNFIDNKGDLVYAGVNLTDRYYADFKPNN